MIADVAKDLGLWVTQYLAIFCLVTLAAMAGGHYLLVRKADNRLRDFALYLGGIGALCLLLTVMPVRGDSLLWPPLAWFCFTMLLMLELLWIAFMVETLVRFTLGLYARFAHRAVEKAPRVPHPGGTPYARM